ncbi:tetratricopeptide repeat protein [Nitrosopumilus sp.]|uniref:tetratricopeptide repeat protein n=1 Tax=Nitrosopumilus sp. TaxID=2024843 RepID=UPI00247DADD3|nr:tetratricopeptide repeat protein [Nitrosopumilus sp.]MCV0431277.1 tetratricopeptide repeat protein [Nitrosopumilus sp.]
MVGLFKHPKRKIKKLLKDGEYDEAIKFGQGLESEYSDDHDFMFIMGSAFFIVDDAKRALPYFQKAFELDNDDVETLTLKTNVHLALEQKNEAIECCQRILKLEPKNTEAQQLLDELESV